MSGKGKGRGRGRARAIQRTEDQPIPHQQRNPQQPWGPSSSASTSGRGRNSDISAQQLRNPGEQRNHPWGPGLPAPTLSVSSPQVQRNPQQPWGPCSSAPRNPQQPWGPGLPALRLSTSDRERSKDISPQYTNPPNSIRQIAPTSASTSSTAGGPKNADLSEQKSEMILATQPEPGSSKKGTSGEHVILTANYIKLMDHTKWCLYQYRVDFSPQEDRTYVRKLFLKEHKMTIGAYIFDGSIMYTAHRLLPKAMEFSTTRNSDNVRVLITIKLVCQLGMGDFQYIHFFNVLLRMCYHRLKLQLVGRDFYDANAKINMWEHKLELWPGYRTSIRQHESSIMMCAEVTHKVMRKDTVLDILRDCHRANNRYLQEDFEKRVIGGVVLTEYNNKTYRIDSVDWDQSPKTKFKRRNGDEISFMQYYVEKYQIKIRDQTQPMLVHRAKKKDVRAGHSELCALVPELCRTTGLTDNMRTNFELMRAVANHTRVNPAARIKKLNEFSKRLRTTKESMNSLKQWQMVLADPLIQFGGRVLNTEDIYFGKKIVQLKQDVDWTRDLQSNSMLHIVTIPNWTILVPRCNRREAKDFVKILQTASENMSFIISEPKWYEIPDDRNSTYTEALERILATGGTQSIIMCVVPNNRNDRYAAIKKKTCVDRAVATQVILAKNLSCTKNESLIRAIAAKVAIQMNCKMGGFPWSVKMHMSRLMVIGFDVCHDTSDKSRSYGALVASLDRGCGRYFSTVSHHSEGEELANHMVINVTKALHAYKRVNTVLPSHIVFYRDGVGDGQIPYVHDTEVSPIRKQIDKMYKNEKLEPVKMAYIIVSKRLNTRIFTREERNPLPGTVVDDVITLPERYDFFLVSQTVRQGTVSPTSYNIISDNLGLDPDKIQRLTYKLTHLYFNWSGTCRVPAPCQYAHKLAFLVGKYLHRSPHENIEQSLYFL